ncbi:MAG: DUF1329 domain-containing protein [Rhodocyclaceae bacterium]|jgi:hypothetical protein|nr:DUF1329 domain-containing protein [Rhodocyclaceae bacterium]
MLRPSLQTFLILTLTTGLVGSAQAAVTAAEAARLGTQLTPVGADATGNPEGTIPPYTGGLPATTRPPGYQANSGRWADPYAGEKPIFSITAGNMEHYADKLSEASKALLQRHPSYRMDIYPSHRSTAMPPAVLEATRKNATNARLAKDGLALEGAYGGVPFPLPRNGHEVMWNHLARYNGHANEFNSRNWYVDASGRAVNSGEIHAHQQSPMFDPKGDETALKKNGNFLAQATWNFTGPPMVVGNATLYLDTLDPLTQPRRAWTYNAASRRIRLAPDVAYDTPIASQGGVTTYDDIYLFDGAMDLFDFKLLGKREMFIPYNSYAVTFHATAQQLLTPRHLNPDHARWELHRVWVVEASLKPGKRHGYARRLFYFDEDLGGGGMSDSFDATGRLIKGLFLASVQLYDSQTPLVRTYWGYDLRSGLYSLANHMGDPGMGFKNLPEGAPPFTFTPDALVSRGSRR